MGSTPSAIADLPRRRRLTQSRKECPLTTTIPISAPTKDKPMTIDEQQPADKQQPAAQNETASEWEDPIERLRRMSDEDKAEYLERMFAEGRRLAHLMLRQEGEPAIPREKLRDALAKKYPGLTLSDQIIEDRKMWYERQASHTAQDGAPNGGQANDD